MKGLGIRSVLDTSLRVWSENFVAFTVIALVVYTPALVVRLVLPAWDSPLMMLPLDIVLDTMVAAPITYGVIMELHGTRPSHRQCIVRGFAQLVPALGASVLAVLAIMGGMVLLVVPGVIVMLMLFVVIPVAVTEQPSAVEALRRSRQLTHGHKGTLLVLLLAIWGLSYGVHDGLAEALPTNVYMLVSIGVDAIFGLLSSITAAVAYSQLRALKEGAQLPDLAQAFARVRS